MCVCAYACVVFCVRPTHMMRSNVDIACLHTQTHTHTKIHSNNVNHFTLRERASRDRRALDRPAMASTLALAHTHESDYYYWCERVCASARDLSRRYRRRPLGFFFRTEPLLTHYANIIHMYARTLCTTQPPQGSRGKTSSIEHTRVEIYEEFGRFAAAVLRLVDDYQRIFSYMLCTRYFSCCFFFLRTFL